MDVHSLDGLKFKELAALAKSLGMTRYSSLRKAELVEAIEREYASREVPFAPAPAPTIKARSAKRAAPTSDASGTAKKRSSAPDSGDEESSSSSADASKAARARQKRSASRRRASSEKAGVRTRRTRSGTTAASRRSRRSRIKPLPLASDSDTQSDFLRLGVCNPFWIWAQWYISENNMNRVHSAMGAYWHTATQVLRVFRVDREPQISTIRRAFLKDVPVKIDIRAWYVPIDNPPSSYMFELGYKTRSGEFFTLASSNIVDTPPRLMHDTPMGGGFGMFEPGAVLPQAGAYATRGYGQGGRRPYASNLPLNQSACVFGLPGPVSLAVDMEIVIKGRVSSGASVRIRDEQIPTRADGSFSVRLNLPERRHVFPVVATSLDESESQTIVLSVDRNTKVLDTVYKEDEE
ncbi:MAG: DUF4912 domain-containing protein [Thermoguttaceae bacterium]|jgi:hypothetical protein